MDKRSGSEDIYAQRVDANGKAMWSANGVVICTANSDQKNSQPMDDGASGAIVIWQDQRRGYDDIYAQRVNDQNVVVVPNSQTPANFALLQNYPNPFNPETAITFQLPDKERVEVIIFNQVGQIIRHLLDEEMQAGYRQVVWDAKNDRGEPVASGIYLCQMVAGEYRSIIKMLPLK